MSRRAVLGLVGAGLTGSLAGCPTTRGDGEVEFGVPGTDSENVENAFTRVYDETIPSVAQVRVTTSRGASQGTCWTFDGEVVVTNFHVVAGATATQVRFGDGAVRAAEIVGVDPYSDLAVLRPEAVPAEPLTLVGDDAAAVPGQRVLVIGSPFGLAGSVSAGIVSGVNRLIPSPAGFPIPDAVQTDAAANPGNSGGPLVSLDGEVLAVINSGGGDNIAFGISAALSDRVVPTLRDEGAYRHAYMGVELGEVTPELAQERDLDAATGLVIAEVFADGPSDGILQVDDVIRRLDDTSVRVLEDLATYLALETSPGDTVAVGLVRDGTERTVDLTLGTRPPPSEAPAALGAGQV